MAVIRFRSQLAVLLLTPRASVLRVLFYSLTVPAETRFFLFGASNYSRCEKLLELYSPRGPPALVPSIIYS